MHAEDVAIAAKDGFSLAATLHAPAGAAPLGVVLINAGTGIRRGFYARYAGFLAHNGCAALTWDYRGIGGSRPASLRGFRATVSDWGGDDLDAVVTWLGQRFPGLPLFVVGHSLGGQILGLLPGNQRIAAVVAVASQSGYWGLWPWPRRWLMAALWWGLMPLATRLLGRFPARALGLGEDLPRGVALEWARWCRSAHYMVDGAGRPLRPHFDALRAPVLAYSFEDDAFAPRPAVEELLSFYRHAPVTHRHLRPAERGLARVGHFGFFREESRAALWEESLAWFRRHATV